MEALIRYRTLPELSGHPGFSLRVVDNPILSRPTAVAA